MLTESLIQRFDLEGIRVNLCIPFNHILLFYELQADEMFTDTEKIELGFNLLCKVKSKKRIPLKTKVKIIEYIFKEFINITKGKKSESEKKVFDFNQDSEYIYASFMSEYKIDLLKEIDQLDWRKFIMLFNGLSDESKIKQVIKIRSMPIPKATKHNGEQISAIMEAKSFYALELSEEERQQQFAESLKKIAQKFIQ